MRTFSSEYTTALTASHTEPIKLLEIALSGGTLYYSDRSITIDTTTYSASVLKWGSFGVYYDLATTLQQSGNGSFDIIKSDAVIASIMSDNWENSEVELKLYFADADESETIYKGVISSIAPVDDELDYISINVTDITVSKQNEQIGYTITTDNFDDAYEEHVGLPIPIVFGEANNSPCRAIDIGARTYLDGSLYEDDTTIYVLDTNSGNGFPSAGTLIVDNEEITYTSKTDTAFSGCTRGANGTTATQHRHGTEVIEKQTYYVFVANDGASKAINAVYVGTEKLQISTATEQTGQYFLTSKTVLGKNTAGGTPKDHGYGWLLAWCFGTASSSGTLSSINFHIADGGNNNFKIGIYSDNSDYPYELLAETEEKAVGAVNAWVNFNLTESITITSGNKYWFVVNHDASFFYANYDSTSGLYGYQSAYANGMPATYAIGAASWTYGLSLYGDIVEGGLVADGWFALNNTNTKIACKFTTDSGEAGIYNAITLHLRSQGTIPVGGNVFAQVYSNSGGAPSAQIGSNSEDIDATAISSSGENITFVFENNDVVLAESTSYWIVIDCDYTKSASYSTDVAYDDSYSTNGEGANASLYNGSSWSAQNKTIFYSTQYTREISTDTEAIIDTANTDYGRTLSIIKLLNPPKIATPDLPSIERIPNADNGTMANGAGNTAGSASYSYDQNDATYATVNASNRTLQIQQTDDLSALGTLKKVWVTTVTRSQYAFTSDNLYMRYGKSGAMQSYQLIDRAYTGDTTYTYTARSVNPASVTDSGSVWTNDNNVANFPNGDYASSSTSGYLRANFTNPSVWMTNIVVHIQWSDDTASSNLYYNTEQGYSGTHANSATVYEQQISITSGNFPTWVDVTQQGSGGVKCYNIWITYDEITASVDENSEKVVTRRDITSVVRANDGWGYIQNLLIEVYYSGSSDGINAYIHEAYIEVEYENVSYEIDWNGVYCDIEGVTDDGTINGNLIQNYPDAIKFMLNRIGITSSYIDGNSFDSVKTQLSIDGFACNGTIWENIDNPLTYIQQIAVECKSVLYSFIGKLYLSYRNESSPTPLTTFVCSQTSTSNNIIKNTFRCERSNIANAYPSVKLYYNEDLSLWTKPTDIAFNVTTTTDNTAKTALHDLNSVLTFIAKFCTSQTQAENLRDWFIADFKQIKTLVRFYDVLKSATLEPFDVIGITQDKIGHSNKAHEIIGITYNLHDVSSYENRADIIEIVCREVTT